MTNDLENRLRAAGESLPELDIDESAVFTKGRRLVRARRIRAASALAVLVVAGGIAISPALRTSHMGVPAEDVSAHAPASGGGASDSAESSGWSAGAVLEVPQLPSMADGTPAAPEEKRTVKVTVEPTGTEMYKITYEFFDADGNSIGITGSNGLQGMATWGHGSFIEGLLIGFIDDEARVLDLFQDPKAQPEGSGITGNEETITKPDGTKGTVFLRRFSEASQAESVAELTYLTPDGRVHSSELRPVSQVRFDQDSQSRTAYYIPTLGALGVTGTTGSILSDELDPDELATGRINLAWGSGSDAGGYTASRAGVLPEGSTDVALEYADKSARGRPWRFFQVAESDSGEVFWYTQLATDADSDDGVKALTWVDAAGEAHRSVFP